MKKYIVVLLFFNFLETMLLAQQVDLKGTYLSDSEDEYIQIDVDSFKIKRTFAYSSCLDSLDIDSIASIGSVECLKNGFLKLTSQKKDLQSKIEESVVENIGKDTVLAIFIFPLKGLYRIEASVGSLPYLSTYCNNLKLPKSHSSVPSLFYKIYSLCLDSNSSLGSYCGSVVYSPDSFYDIERTNTNKLVVYLPNLTNDFFARYVINEEFVKVEADQLKWRGVTYRKISNKFICPEIDHSEKSLESEPGEDIKPLKNKFGR